MISKMVRWVRRTGKDVEFGNVVGPFVGSTYRYAFPSTQLAKRFEALAKSTENGLPAGIPRETWGRYAVQDEETAR